MQGHTPISDMDILLTYAHYRNQVITLLPTPNDLSSSWDFLPRRSLDMLVGLEPSTESKEAFEIVKTHLVGLA